MIKGLPITSSVIVAKAAGMVPEGVKAKEDGICAYCGLHIAKEDLCAPFSPSGAFMDDASLAVKGSPVSCGHCAVLLGKDSLRTTGYGMFSESGAMPFRKWADVAKALTSPPPPPFVVVYATANNQHMAWRAPINYSTELFYVRVGLRDLKIRRQYLLKSVDACERVGNAFGGKASGRIRAHPFMELSDDLKAANLGKFRHTVFSPDRKTNQTAEEHAALFEAHRTDIDFLLNLTLGEIWALRFVLDTGAALRAAETF